MMIRTIAFLLLALPSVLAWTAKKSVANRAFVPLFLSKDKNGPGAKEIETEDPCWEEFYDDDCAMRHAYAASFVEGEWLKSMPCGEGIKDCDMPEALKVPENRPEASLDEVDVMGFLGLKKAKELGHPKSDDDDDNKKGDVKP